MKNIKKLHLFFVTLYTAYFIFFIKYLTTPGSPENYDIWLSIFSPILATISIIIHSILWAKIEKNNLEKIFLCLSFIVAIFFVIPYLFPQTSNNVFDFIISPLYVCGAWGCGSDFFIEFMLLNMVVWFIWIISTIIGFVSIFKND